MTIREAADILGLKVRTIREWIKKGKIKAWKIGSRWIISYEDITSKEVQDRANKSREHSRRIKEGGTVGMCKQG